MFDNVMSHVAQSTFHKSGSLEINVHDVACWEAGRVSSECQSGAILRESLAGLFADGSMILEVPGPRFVIASTSLILYFYPNVGALQVEVQQLNISKTWPRKHHVLAWHGAFE